MKLAELQHRFAGALMASPDHASAQRFAKVIHGIVKPNSRLSAMERFEIYRDSYWMRLFGCFADDFQGLRGILGDQAFHRLSQAYLLARPSQSFTLRNLGLGLDSWLRANQKWAGKRIGLALDMVRLEWAHVEAFDGCAVDPVEPEDLAGHPAKLHLALQPHISLLALSYPVDLLRLRLLQLEQEIDERTLLRREQLAAIGQDGKRARVFLGVHRRGTAVFYRRLEKDEFRLLKAFRRGANLEQALSGFTVEAVQLGSWFEAWAQLGWLAKQGVTE